jgi:hypothetical protein
MTAVLICFNPMDFCLWWHLKILVYLASVHNMKTLHQWTLNAYQIVHNYPEIFEHVLQSIISCVEAYIKSQGGHFEHFM